MNDEKNKRIILMVEGAAILIIVLLIIFLPWYHTKNKPAGQDLDKVEITEEELSESVAADRGNLMAFISAMSIEPGKNLLDDPANRVKYVEFYLGNEAETSDYVNYSIDKSVFVNKYGEFFGDDEYVLDNTTCPEKSDQYCWQDNVVGNGYELVDNNIAGNNASSGTYEKYADGQDGPVSSGAYNVTYKKINGEIVIDSIIFE